MKTNLIKILVIAFAIGSLGMMSAVAQEDAQPVDQGVQNAADAIYHTNEQVSNAYQDGFDQAQAAQQAAEEGEDEEEGGCCG